MKTDKQNKSLHLLDITRIEKEETLLDTLQNLHQATLTGNDKKIRQARYESRRILMKYRPSLYQ